MPRRMIVFAAMLVAALGGTASAAADASAVGSADACVSMPGDAAAAQPILGQLPVSASSSPRDIAAFALPYARMIHLIRRPSSEQLAPPGFARGPDSRAWFAAADPGAAAWAAASGFYAVAFVHCAAQAIVIAFDATSLRDPRDLIAVGLRHIAGGWSALGLRFVDAIREGFPDHHVTLIGESAGAGIASFVGSRRNLPSLAFNPARTIAAASNDGAQQLVVIVEGDLIADPDAMRLRVFREPRAVAGVTLRVTVAVRFPLLQLHAIDTTIAGLTALLP